MKANSVPPRTLSNTGSTPSNRSSRRGPCRLRRTLQRVRRAFSPRWSLRTLTRSPNGRRRMAAPPHHAPRSRLPQSAVESEREKHNKFHPGKPEPDESLLRGRALQTRTVELTRFERYGAQLSRRQRQAHQALIECRKQENQQYAAVDRPAHSPATTAVRANPSITPPVTHPGKKTMQGNEPGLIQVQQSQ